MTPSQLKSYSESQSSDLQKVENYLKSLQIKNVSLENERSQSQTKRYLSLHNIYRKESVSENPKEELLTIKYFYSREEVLDLILGFETEIEELKFKLSRKTDSVVSAQR